MIVIELNFLNSTPACATFKIKDRGAYINSFSCPQTTRPLPMYSKILASRRAPGLVVVFVAKP